MLKVPATDIDASLEELFDVSVDFREPEECAKLLAYVRSFYPLVVATEEGQEVEVHAQYQCERRRLLVATVNQALDVAFVEGKLCLMVWRRLVGAPVRKADVDLIRGFTLQFGGWLWDTTTSVVD